MRNDYCSNNSECKLIPFCLSNYFILKKYSGFLQIMATLDTLSSKDMEMYSFFPSCLHFLFFLFFSFGGGVFPNFLAFFFLRGTSTHACSCAHSLQHLLGYFLEMQKYLNKSPLQKLEVNWHFFTFLTSFIFHKLSSHFQLNQQLSAFLSVKKKNVTSTYNINTHLKNFFFFFHQLHTKILSSISYPVVPLLYKSVLFSFVCWK